MTERKEGWYWVKADGEWQPAKYSLHGEFSNDHLWEVVGVSWVVEDCDLEAIGPYIETPNNLENEG